MARGARTFARGRRRQRRPALPNRDMLITRRPLAGARQRQIMTLLQETGALRIDDLTEMFDVSNETVRRDLAVLEEQGLLTRTRGGALAESVRLETSFQRRMRENGAEKLQIARIAASYVQDGSTIIIDSGSTMAHLVRQLRSKRDLVVITNGINHVEDLLSNPTLTVVVTGGLVRRATVGAAGPLAVESLTSLHADGTKSGRASMVKVAPLTEVNRIITSQPISLSELSKIRDLGVELIIAGQPGSAEDDLPSQADHGPGDAQ